MPEKSVLERSLEIPATFGGGDGDKEKERVLCVSSGFVSCVRRCGNQPLLAVEFYPAV